MPTCCASYWPTRIARRAAFGSFLAVSLAAAPAVGQTVRQGVAFIDTANSVCSEKGWTPDTYFMVVYRPILANQDGPEGLAFYTERLAFVVNSASAATRLNGTGNYTGDLIDTHAISSSNDGRYRLAISAVSPATQTVTISGTITDFVGVSDCTITFHSALTLRP